MEFKTSIIKAVATGRIQESQDYGYISVFKLKPNKLKDQYCFKTVEAIKCLEFVEDEKIWLKK